MGAFGNTGHVAAGIEEHLAPESRHGNGVPRGYQMHGRSWRPGPSRRCPNGAIAATVQPVTAMAAYRNLHRGPFMALFSSAFGASPRCTVPGLAEHQAVPG